MRRIPPVGCLESMEFVETIKRYDQQLLWDKVFEFIVQDSNYSAKDFTCKEAMKHPNYMYNRYQDVLPYDHSRVQLNWKVVSRTNTDYINANMISVFKDEKRYIITQSPLGTTLKHFWQMIWQEKCSIIVMLNKIEERNDAAQYFPTDVDNDIEMEGCTISFVSEKSTRTYILRELRLIKTDLPSTATEFSQVILHYQYIEWPDYGVPESSVDFVSFVMAIKKEFDIFSSTSFNGPMVIHCSAGIGRSGTYALVDACLEQVNRQKDIVGLNPVKTLLDLRAYRSSLIQTCEQLRFAFKSIAKGIELNHPELFISSIPNEKRRIKVNETVLSNPAPIDDVNEPVSIYQPISPPGRISNSEKPPKLSLKSQSLALPHYGKVSHHLSVIALESPPNLVKSPDQRVSNKTNLR